MKRDQLFALILFTFFIFSLAPARVSASADGGAAQKGKSIFTSNGCNDCHSTVAPSKVSTFEEFEAKEGPDLWYAGSKFKASFLQTWLKDPVKIRPLKFNSIKDENPGDHPSLKAGEAGSVAEYLMTLKAEKMAPVGIKAKKSVAGRIIFEKKQACYGCHKLKKGSDIIGGLSGPSLVGSSERLNPEWIYSFLKEPKAYMLLGRMPEYSTLLTDKELRKLTAHIATF